MAEAGRAGKVPVDFAFPIGTVEAARRLGTGGRDVYDLLLAGVLRGGPDRRGFVVIDADSVDEALAARSGQSGRAAHGRPRAGDATTE